MGSLPGIKHLQAVRALEKLGYRVVRQSGHIIMSDGTRTLTVPRNNLINAFTMDGIIKTAGISTDEFRKLL